MSLSLSTALGLLEDFSLPCPRGPKCPSDPLVPHPAHAGQRRLPYVTLKSPSGHLGQLRGQRLALLVAQPVALQGLREDADRQGAIR